MKFFIGFLSAIAAITGILYYFFNRKSKQTAENYEIDYDFKKDVKESSSAVIEESLHKESSKQYSVANIKDRHREAGELIKESMNQINEESAVDCNKNKAKLNQIFDDLKEI